MKIINKVVAATTIAALTLLASVSNTRGFDSPTTNLLTNDQSKNTSQPVVDNTQQKLTSSAHNNTAIIKKQKFTTDQTLTGPNGILQQNLPKTFDVNLTNDTTAQLSYTKSNNFGTWKHTLDSSSNNVDWITKQDLYDSNTWATLQNDFNNNREQWIKALKYFTFKQVSIGYHYIKTDYTTVTGITDLGKQQTDLIIPEGVQVIGQWAFSDFRGTVTIPSSVRQIHQNAFAWWNNGDLSYATSEIINNSPVLFNWWVYNHLYGQKAMREMSIVNLNLLTNSVGQPFTIIADYTFENHFYYGDPQEFLIDKIFLSDQTTYIGDGAFTNGYFSSMTIPSTVTYIGKDVFEKCYRLTSDNMVNNSPVLFKWWVWYHRYNTPNGKKTIWEMETVDLNKWTNSAGEPFTILAADIFSTAHIKYLILNSQTTQINSLVSWGLETVNWDDLTNLQSIGDEAFAWSQLSRVIIPKTVIYIGKDVFKGCNRLTNDNVVNNSPVLFDWWVRNHAAPSWNSKEPKTMWETKWIDLNFRWFTNSAGKPFTIIGPQAFKDDQNLRSFSFSNWTTAIYEEAFANCYQCQKFQMHVFSKFAIVSVGINVFQNDSEIEQFDDLKRQLQVSIADELNKLPSAANNLHQANPLSFTETNSLLYNFFPKNQHHGEIDKTTVAMQWEHRRLFGLDEDFSPSSSDFTTYYDFPVQDILQFKIDNNNASGVLKTSPTFSFDFTDDFKNLLLNIYYLPQAMQLLQTYIDELQFKAGSNPLIIQEYRDIITNIKNCNLDYQNVADYLNHGIDVVGQKDQWPLSHIRQLTDHLGQFGCATWYKNAQTNLGLDLQPIPISDWHYLLALTSLRFSHNLNINAHFNSTSQPVMQNIWDSVQYNFVKFNANNYQPDQDLINQNKAQLKISYPFNDLLLPHSFFTLTTSGVVQGTTLVNDTSNQSITCTYFYAQNLMSYQLTADFVEDQTVKQINNVVSRGQLHLKIVGLQNNPNRPQEPFTTPLVDHSLPFTVTLLPQVDPTNNYVTFQVLTITFDTQNVQLCADHNFQTFVLNNLFANQPSLYHFAYKP